MSVGPPWFSPTKSVEGSCAPARANSSYQMSCSIRAAPRPPYSFGQEMPAQPASNMRRCQARSKARRPAMSFSTGGSLGLFASIQARAAARNFSSSGLKVISIAGSYVGRARGVQVGHDPRAGVGRAGPLRRGTPWTGGASGTLTPRTAWRNLAA